MEGLVVDEDTADTFLHTRKEQMVKGMEVPMYFHKIGKKNPNPVMFLILFTDLLRQFRNICTMNRTCCLANFHGRGWLK